MTKLSDTQLIILTAACQHPDRLILPLPANLKGGAASKVIDSLAAKGLIEEVDAKRCEPVWRETGDGHGVTLVATDAALAALGILPEPTDDGTGAAAEEAPDAAPTGADGANEGEPGIKDAPEADGAHTAPAAAKPRKTRTDTKQALLIELLQRPEGATAEQVAEATGWQKHTIRGAIAGALKKKLGLTILTERVRMVGPNREGAPGSYTTYRIAE